MLDITDHKDNENQNCNKMPLHSLYDNNNKWKIFIFGEDVEKL